jgi:hypothetical protein
MATALARLLSVALGFALSPMALVQMVLVLFSRRAKTNGLVFLAAIMVPVFLVPFLGAAGEDMADASASSRSTVQTVVLLVFAVVLLVIAWNNFRARHSDKVPAIFDKIDGMGPFAVVVLSLGVTVANPKNIVLLLGAGAMAGAQGLSTGELALTLAIFTLIATAPFIIMVGYLQFGGDAAVARLEVVKAWLLRHNHVIMAVVLLVVALVLGVLALG